MAIKEGLLAMVLATVMTVLLPLAVLAAARAVPRWGACGGPGLAATSWPAPPAQARMLVDYRRMEAKLARMEAALAGKGAGGGAQEVLE